MEKLNIANFSDVFEKLNRYDEWQELYDEISAEIKLMPLPIMGNGINLSDTVIKAHRRDITAMSKEKSLAS